MLAVSRIARLMSQTVINVSSQTSLSPDNVILVSPDEDIVATVRRACQAYTTAGLVSLVAPDCAESLPRLLLPHAGELSQASLVVHIEVKQDFSSVFLLRTAFPYLLLSVNPLEARDNSIIASYLARSFGLAVIHVYFCNGDTADVTTDLFLEEKLVLDYGLKDMGGKDFSVREDDVELLWRLYQDAISRLSCFSSRPLQPFSSQYSKQGSEIDTVIIIVGHICTPEISLAGVQLIYPKIMAPLSSSTVLEIVPPHATRVFILEQTQDWPMKWTSFYLEVVCALQQRNPTPVIRGGILGHDKTSITDSDLETLLTSPEARVQLGSFVVPNSSVLSPLIPRYEAHYLEVLKRLFDVRFEHSNSPHLTTSHGHLCTNPEFALGRVRGQLEERARLVKTVEDLIHGACVDSDLHSLLSKWYLHRDDNLLSRSCGEEIVQELERNIHNPMLRQLFSLKHYFTLPSHWIVVSSWSYDLGSSGLHHILASGLRVNILIIHTTPYTLRRSNSLRQHDIGLYAMNYGSAYVASVALYSSYAQTIQALVEADRYSGPSVVLGYLPYVSDLTLAMDVLQETKLAVDNGYWSLYRWDPSKEIEGGEPLSLDSNHIKNDLAQFVDRQNHLSQLVRSKPDIAPEIAGSVGLSLKETRWSKARESYSKLLRTVDAPSMRILYASDGGNAEKMAKRLATRGKLRGLDVTVATLDSMPIDALRYEDGHVVFITSTAGQGEPPQNGRTFFKTLNSLAAASHTENQMVLLSRLRYLVFGLGDSHYWPRAEDAHYYNRPSKELDSKLALLGAQRILDLHLGDAHDTADSETLYKVWEARVWKVFGVDTVEVSEKEPEPITLEHIKAASNYLRGTIAEGILDTSTGSLALSDPPLTKYHGIWQQDDRDVREERQAQGLEPAYNFMVRARMPGGSCTPEQWLKLDHLTDEYGNGTMKITTRQTLQFHGILKRYLKKSIQDINKALLDTLEVGGDINSNIVCSSIPTMSEIHAQVHNFCIDISKRLMPRTTAYHEIWLDEKMVAGHAVKDFEPLYSEWYLPRKFKIAVAVPPFNDVDVFTNDLGYIAIADGDGKNVIGYNVLVGGGMGTTLGNQKTYPRLASLIGFCTPDQAVDVAEKVTSVQRDHGDRVDRKTARLKYTVDRMGLDKFKAEVERRLGYPLQESRPYSFTQNLDQYGWTMGENNKHYFTLFIENGRIQDTQDMKVRTGLREIAKLHQGSFRLTTNQHLVISEIEAKNLSNIKSILSKYNMDSRGLSGLRLSSSACVAFPTCGLAMAESERYLPILIDKIEIICEENGLRNDSIIMRMTGCPAGCTRPNVAEIGFIGKAPGTYVMILGGGACGQRLAKVYRENVTEPEILAILGPMIKHYALDRLEGERFGEFVIRTGYVPAVTSSHEFWMSSQ